ncbi:MAG TPA: Asp23/Gls24 family envelope stress response protein [Acidimicrobiales bacterium]|nr:Asp23/Gls24 family envelope stress response protein [Acidimicrobiales bacterium]
MSEYSSDNLTAGNGPEPYPPRRDEPFRGATGQAQAVAPAPTPSPVPASPSPSAAMPPRAAQPAPAAGPAQQAMDVKGRIHIADEVVEKVAGLAATEVPGVADLGGDFERALESVRERIGIGNKRGDQGVKAEVQGHDVAVSVTIMVEFGHVVMDVARQVQANVARQVNRMLGLRVVEVNVTVDDVRTAPAERGGRADEE